jgi:DNA-binding NtrC family response regulator
MARLLVVDDKDSIRTMLEMRLTAAGHAVVQAENVVSADRALGSGEFDVVITDLRMGRGGDGLDVLRKVKDQQPQTEVIVMTAFGSDDVRERALELGALCYLEKSPRLASEVIPLVQRALEKRELVVRGKSLAHDNQLLREQLEGRGHLGEMVGRSAAMQGVFQLVEKVAAARTTVLITGESGVGKELVASAVHEKSLRGQGRFVPVNCGAIPEGLIESELFGHVKGAFTGAASDKEGLFQTAQGGTLFLDEIAELPTALQVKLLRAIQDRRIRPVGGTEDVEVDVRIVAATNRDLPAEVRASRFREDLYYRLNVVQIRVPPLRDRREDILPLADHFLARFGAEHQRPNLRLSREARRRLDEYDFPGNVRELENLVEQAAALAHADEIDSSDVFIESADVLPTATPPNGVRTLSQEVDAAEKRAIEAAVERNQGVLEKVARELDVSTTTLWRKMKRLGLRKE